MGQAPNPNHSPLGRGKLRFSTARKVWEQEKLSIPYPRACPPVPLTA